MRPWTVTSVGIIILSAVSSVTAMGQVRFGPRPGAIVIRVGVEPLATYVYEDTEILRPYFKDVCAPGGIRVTRRRRPRDGVDPTDHADMHPGLFLAFGDLGGADFWRNKAMVEHVAFARPPCSQDGTGSFSVRNRYVAGHAVICEELCTYRFMVRPSGYLILWDSTFRAAGAETHFGDQEEMGLGVRVTTPIMVKSAQGGRILDSEGRLNEKGVWGKPAAWCDYSGPVGGAFAGVMILPDPGNFRPCWWHVRDYGFMVANPFGRRALTSGLPSKVAVRPDEPLALRFGVLLHASDSKDGLDLQAACRDYLEVAESIRRVEGKEHR